MIEPVLLIFLVTTILEWIYILTFLDFYHVEEIGSNSDFIISSQKTYFLINILCLNIGLSLSIVRRIPAKIKVIIFISYSIYIMFNIFILLKNSMMDMTSLST